MPIVRLRVLSQYVNKGLFYTAGQEIQVEEDLAEFLLQDAPGVFELLQVETLERSFDGPPADKMVKWPQRKK